MNSALSFFSETLDSDILSFLQAVKNSGGRAFIVGGIVRDLVMAESFFDANVAGFDIDIEVFGLEFDVLQAIVSEFSAVDSNMVGKHFGVFKVVIGGKDLDVALPRSEEKTGPSHTDFSVMFDPNMSLEEAASRRDFTINTLMLDPLVPELVDPTGKGLSDIQSKILRPVSHRFAEDPLRVLRGMQFAARFGMVSDLNSDIMLMNLADEFHTIPVERVWHEWAKLADKGEDFGTGLFFLLTSGWVEHFPEIKSLRFCQQNHVWHPEGDVFHHTFHVMNAMKEVIRRAPILLGCSSFSKHERIVLMLSALTHDMGKPHVTFNDNGVWKSPGHEDPDLAAAPFLHRIGAPKMIIDQVSMLTKLHMRRPQTAKGVRRLAVELDLVGLNINHLLALIIADQSGRPFDGGLIFKEKPRNMKRIADELDLANNAPEPIIKGRHLIEHLSWKPGPEFGTVLQRCFHAQIDGEFDETTAIEWLQDNFGR